VRRGLRRAQSTLRPLHNVRFRFCAPRQTSIIPGVRLAHWSKAIRRSGVGLWIGATVMLVASLWLLLFVAPALFNAHTRTGLGAFALLILASPVLIAAVIDRLRHASRD
jgi:uncharacterized transporter YbjL